MKKFILTSLVMVCLILSLVSCGSSNSDPIQPAEVIVNTEMTENISIEVVETTIAETTAVLETTADVNGIVLYDANDIKITCKGYTEDDSFWGPTLKYLVENNTNKNITVQVRDCSVNGFMVDPTCSTDVASGKKANDTMTWFESDFEENDIDAIETIEFYFHIYDADEWETIVDSEIITLNFN